MATRVGTMADVPEIMKFLEKYHVESDLKDIPFVKMDMMNHVEHYITFPRHVCFVYEREDKIRGVLLGSADPFMFNRKRRWATDLLNICDEGGAWVLKRFLAWAKANKVDRVFMGVSTGNENSNRLYEAVGMKRLGGMYGLDLNQEAQ